MEKFAGKSRMMSARRAAAPCLVFLLAFLPLAVLRAAEDRPLIGAIRWDGWYGDGVVTRAVESSLSPPKYHFRLPWFAQVRDDGTVRVNGDSPAVMEQEIA